MRATPDFSCPTPRHSVIFTGGQAWYNFVSIGRRNRNYEYIPWQTQKKAQ